jgi:AraC-like DNA-binding protein
MASESCPPFPHHTWLAHWIGVQAPRVCDTFECRHVAHHVRLTTSGDADVEWTSSGRHATYHTRAGDVGFFPCDQQTQSMVFKAADGVTVYDLIIPDLHLRSACLAEGMTGPPEGPAVPEFRDPLMAASLLRLSTRSAAHQVSEEIGDEIAARQIVVRICVLAGTGAPDWHKDESVFTPSAIRHLIADIDGHLGGPMSLQMLATTVGLSPGHFARKFRHSVGLSLNRFINIRRVAASFALLREESLSLAAVALETGFCSQSHFTRLFSGLTGLTPLQFQRMHHRTVG